MENKKCDYLKQAILNNDFQGLISFTVKEGDIFEIDASEYKVIHRLSGSRGKILGAWARCDRKNMKPFLIYIEFDEHKRETEDWNNHPSLMIQKQAERLILERAFPVNETKIDEEIKTNLISRAQQKRMFAISKGNENILREVLEDYGLTSTSEVLREKYEEICSSIENLVNEPNESQTIEGTEIEDAEFPWQ